jgi:hypothetical protein
VSGSREFGDQANLLIGWQFPTGLDRQNNHNEDEESAYTSEALMQSAKPSDQED